MPGDTRSFGSPAPRQFAAGYRVAERLRRGADSVIYRAVRESDDREVVLKVFHAESHPVEQEAARLRALPDHPHLAAVAGHGHTDDGLPYLALAYHPGGSYEEWTTRFGPISVDEAVQVGVAVADALAAVHDAGLLHGDLTPGNILRGTAGPVLTDFATAAVADQATTGTVALDRLTPPHAAPEVLLGQPADARSDLYGLASTIWTLLAGYPPFATPGARTIDPFEYREQAVHVPVPPVPRGDVPWWLQAVLQRAMAKAPAERYPDAAAFGAALRTRTASVAADAAQPEQPAPVSPVDPMSPVSPVSPVSQVSPAGGAAMHGSVLPHPGPAARPTPQPVAVTQPPPVPVPVAAAPPAADGGAHLPIEIATPPAGERAEPPTTAPASPPAEPPPSEPPPTEPPPTARPPAARPPQAAPPPPAAPPPVTAPFLRRPRARSWVDVQPAGEPRQSRLPASPAAPAAPDPLLFSPEPVGLPRRRGWGRRRWDTGTTQPVPPAGPPAREQAGAPNGTDRVRRAWLVGSVAITAVFAVALVVAVASQLSLRPDPPAQPAPDGEAAGPPETETPAPPASGAAPTDLEIADERVAVALTWQDPTGGQVPFTVLFGPAGDEPEASVPVRAGQTSTRIQGLNPQVDYCFRVLAVASVESDEIPASDQVCTDRFD